VEPEPVAEMIVDGIKRDRFFTGAVAESLQRLAS
jgi:hypothetical protein